MEYQGDECSDTESVTEARGIETPRGHNETSETESARAITDNEYLETAGNLITFTKNRKPPQHDFLVTCL